MPPRRFSRHLFCYGFKDVAGPDEVEDITQLTEREPYVFRQLPDNRQHTVKEGDSLWTVAARYFTGIEGAANLWWVVADFQPDPIHDPTLKLSIGSVLYVPSTRTVLENIFNENRRQENGL